jgi:uncharacterized membrane protein
MNDFLKRFDPAVDKRILIVVSGIIWSAVGIFLCGRAVGWLAQAEGQLKIWLTAAGTVLAFLIYGFGFLKLVNKNIDRIRSKEGKVCVFGFQPWKSYVIIIIMIELGSALRHSPLPKPYLAIIYIGFGGAMVLSSIRYYRTFIKLMSHTK